MKPLPSALVLLFALLLVPRALRGEVVQPAPEIQWVTPTGKIEGRAAFKDQPVVVLIAPTPRTRAFRAQLRNLREVAERLGAHKTVFIAAFTREAGSVPSNIPFVIARDGARVGADFNAGDRFAIAIIGRDGNLDYLTHRVLPGQRVLDVVGNSYVQQTRMRRP